jgi:hypothetical protein
MRMPSNRHPPCRVIRMHELSMTAALSCHFPALSMQTLDHIPDFHNPTLPAGQVSVNLPNV